MHLQKKVSTYVWFPVYNAEQVDEKLEADMDLVLKIVVLGRACRNGAAIKNRQPIGQMYVKAEASLPDYDEAIILDELNVKNITFTDDVSNFTTYNQTTVKDCRTKIR